MKCPGWDGRAGNGHFSLPSPSSSLSPHPSPPTLSSALLLSISLSGSPPTALPVTPSALKHSRERRKALLAPWQIAGLPLQAKLSLGPLYSVQSSPLGRRGGGGGRAEDKAFAACRVGSGTGPLALWRCTKKPAVAACLVRLLVSLLVFLLTQDLVQLASEHYNL